MLLIGLLAGMCVLTFVMPGSISLKFAAVPSVSLFTSLSVH